MSLIVRGVISLIIAAVAHAVTGMPFWLAVLLGMVLVFGGWFVYVEGDWD